MQPKLKRLAGALVLAICGTGAVSASTVFDNTSNGYTNDGDNWYQALLPSHFMATRFTVGAGTDYMLDKITVRLNSLSSVAPTPTALLNMSIHADNGTADAGAIGASLGSLTNFTGLVYPQPAGSSASFDFTPIASILLQQGASYWARLSPVTQLSANIGWDDLNTNSVAGAVLADGGIGPQYEGNRSMPLIVEGTVHDTSPVPIPGAVWLMGSALIGFAGWGRRTAV